MPVNAHDHFNFYKDLEKGLAVIEKNKIQTLVVSMNIDEYLELREKYKKNPLIKIGIGVHPWEVQKDTILNFEDLIKDADFIGEIGLDFFWDKRTALYKKQEEVFEFFLKMAQKYEKIVNIHTKGAEKNVLSLLKKYKLKNPIIHWYSGDIKYVKEYLDLNAYFTISVDAGYSNLTDELINILPIDKILTETDGPTSLEWVNGNYQESDYLIEILKYIAKIKKMDFLKIQEMINNNFLNLGL